MTESKGNLLLLYAFDIGDEVDLNLVHSKKLISSLASEASPHFKNYHIPLSVKVDRQADDVQDVISCKVHGFDVISLCYKVSVS